MEEEKSPDRIVAPKNRASDQMVAKLLNVTRKFTETLEDRDMRKQELIESSSKTSCKSLDFDDLLPPFRGRRQQFTPLRMAVQLISASQDDFELEADSMTSQSSRTTCTRLM